jgi:putative transcriptional regulator
MSRGSPHARVSAGRLLVANPLLPDPNFDRTVVLLIAHSGEGALGLVLNRPSQMEVGDPLPQWARLAAEPPVLFLGGPVAHQAVICLARRPGPAPAGAGPEVAPGVATVDLDQDPEQALGGAGPVRLFAGYAGWAPGQLEGELEAGAWWVVDAEPSDPFTLDPKGLWRAVLRRQRPPLCFVAWFPEDPSRQ